MAANNSDNNSDSTHPDMPPFPDPSLFSILPDIYLLIARLKTLQTQLQPSQTSLLAAPPTDQNPTLATTQTQPSPRPDPGNNPSSNAALLSATSATATPPPPPPPTTTTTSSKLGMTNTAMITTQNHLAVAEKEQIDPKDLPFLIQPIKQKIAKAKNVVSGLPDVERSVKEQEQEIQALELRIEALRGRVGVLGAAAGVNTERQLLQQQQQGQGQGRGGTDVKTEAETQRQGDVVMQGVEG